MANITLQQLIQDAKNAGFTGTSLQDIVAISQAEDTSGNPTATNSVGNSAGIDRGVLQINSFYHPEVSTQCADDPQCSFNAAFRISNGGTNFNQWATFTSGKYLQFLSNSSTSIPVTSTTNLPGTITGQNFQDFLMQSLFVVGGAIIIVMGFVMVFKIPMPRLAV